MNNTGHALFDPTPLFTPEEAAANEAEFLQMAKDGYVTPQTRRRRKRREHLKAQVVEIAEAEAGTVTFEQIGERLNIGKSYANRLYKEWRAEQK